MVVDAHELGDGSRLRGMATVLRHLLDGLSRQPDLELVALARPRAPLPDGVERLELVRRDVRPRFAHLEHDLLLPRDLRRGRADVVWAPANHPPRLTPAPLVQTLHDLIPLSVPDPGTMQEARRWRRRATRVRAARTVVTDSRWSANQAIRLLDIDPSRVEIIHPGVDPVYAPGPPETTGSPYLLTVAAFGAHKGMSVAMSVTAALAEEGYPHRLRLAGPQDEWMAARIAELVAGSPRPDRIDVLGWVDDLAAVYRGADAVVCTSQAEGFGLPVAEALACGTPVIAFANSAIPEVVGDAGVLVHDGDVTAFTAAVRRVLDSPTLANELRQAGPERAARFSWERAVSSYRDVLVAAGESRNVQ